MRCEAQIARFWLLRRRVSQSLRAHSQSNLVPRGRDPFGQRQGSGRPRCPVRWTKQRGLWERDCPKPVSTGVENVLHTNVLNFRKLRFIHHLCIRNLKIIIHCASQLQLFFQDAIFTTFFLQKSYRLSLPTVTKYEAAKTGSGAGFCA